MDDTHETQDVPPLAACVNTLQEAVQLSLKDGLNDNNLFTFARALQAFAITNKLRLGPADLQAAFSLWWNVAKPMLPPDADADEWRFKFDDTYAKTRSALGSNPLEEAIRRADSKPLPPQAERYTSAKIKRLVAVCFHLQQLQGNSPFFLGVRDAAKVTDTRALRQASAFLAGLVRDGVLIEVEKGKCHRATRFRFAVPGSTPSTGTSPSESPQAAFAETRPAKAPASRKPSTYELVERKKALEYLLQELGPDTGADGRDDGQRGLLKRELNETNALIAGVPPSQSNGNARSGHDLLKLMRAAFE